MREPAPRRAGLQIALEAVGLGGCLACLGGFLIRSYSVVLAPEPLAAYVFGRQPGAHFGATPLGYGLPLLIRGAAAGLGPFPAWLVNLPVLLGVAALLYALARLQVPTREPAAAALGGAAALGLWVAQDARLLSLLVNPYREAAAAAGLLGAALLAIAASRRPARATALAAGAGAALGLAASVWESSLAMLAPLGLYAAVSKWRDPELPGLRPLLAFALALGAFCVPLAVQGRLGVGLVPLAELGSVLPGIGAALAATGVPLLVAVGLGLALGAWHRLPSVWALSLPAFVLQTALSVGEPRLAFSARLFALCIASAGLALLTDALLARWRPPRAVPLLALLAVFGAASAALLEMRVPRARLRLEGVERFVRDLDAALPPRAGVVAMPPLSDLLGAFGARDVASVRDLPDLEARLPELFGSGERVLLARDDREARSVASRFDLVGLRSLDPAAYGLERRLGPEPIRASRVVPWSRKQARTRVQVTKPGEYRLGVDVGELSAAAGSFSMLFWNDELLGRQPVDGLNYFAVSVPEAPRSAIVRLVSDQPVPARIDAELAPLRRPLVLELDAEHLRLHRSLFSASFLEPPWEGHPAIAREGSVDVPTLRPEDAAYVVEAQIALVPGHAPAARDVVAESGGASLGRWSLGGGKAAGEEPEWRDVDFVLHAPWTRDPSTRVVWRLPDAPAGDTGPALAIRRLQVQRLEVRTALRVEPEAPEAQVYLLDGFGKVERRRGRWTTGDAALRLLVSETEEPGLVTVRYVSAVRLRGRPPRPRFRFDGEPREARFSADARLNTAQILLPPGSLRGIAHRLDIEVPADEHGFGIMLESVRIHPFRRALPSGTSGPASP